MVQSVLSRDLSIQWGQEVLSEANGGSSKGQDASLLQSNRSSRLFDDVSKKVEEIMENCNNQLSEDFFYRVMLRSVLEVEIKNTIKECEERQFDVFERKIMLEMTISLFFKSYDVDKAQEIMDELGVDIDMEELMKDEMLNAHLKYLF